MMQLLARLIGAVHRAQRSRIRDRWKRVLPFGEAFTDRWEKARFLGFGEGASIYDSVLVIGDVNVGPKSWVGPNCVLDGSGGLTIGANCSISSGVQIYSHDTVEWAVSGGVAPYRQQATEIGDHVYLGPNTVVAAGSRIGKGCIIGAQSFVKSELAPYTFAAGCPARVLGRVNVSEHGSVTIIRAEAQAMPSETQT